ncbi:MAG: hypothetical protein CMH25_04480 [Micavibrio sp.]|nr:hypothetical protein [Micavibrio sp.]|tara:strand:+ start:181017 stop:181241 length:225 start_codon:yes stop_codon:yes gene_type:complete
MLAIARDSGLSISNFGRTARATISKTFAEMTNGAQITGLKMDEGERIVAHVGGDVDRATANQTLRECVQVCRVD